MQYDIEFLTTDPIVCNELSELYCTIHATFISFNRTAKAFWKSCQNGGGCGYFALNSHLTSSESVLHGNKRGTIVHAWSYKVTTAQRKHLRMIWLTVCWSIIFILRMLPAYYVCCIYSNACKNTSTMEVNTMNSDQTALGAYYLQYIWPKNISRWESR